MSGCRKGCIGSVLAVLVVIVAVYGGWRRGAFQLPGLPQWLRSGEAVPSGPEPSPEVAQRTVARFERFRSGESGEDELSLEGIEVSSVVRFALSGRLPEGVYDPELHIAEGNLKLRGRVVREAFPRFPDLGGVVDVLPDTVALLLDAALHPLDDGQVALVVSNIEAAGVPIPRRFYPEILTSLGREDRRGLPTDALAIPLPRGVRSAYLQLDRLVLVAER